MPISTPTDNLPAGTLLIGNERLSDSSGGVFEHIYPATGEVNATIVLAGADEVDLAVRAAKSAQAQWVRTSVKQRRDILLKLSDLIRRDSEDLIRISVADNGVPTKISSLMPSVLDEYIRWFAGLIDKSGGTTIPGAGINDVNIIERVPYGVVGVILPWNGPVIQAGMNVIPAIAAGNAVVLKPSKQAPLTMLRFGELALEAGFPPGLLSIVNGDSRTGELIIGHPGVNKIHFTGGSSTGRRVVQLAAENLTPVATELGGKAANIIFDDVDLAQVAGTAAFCGPIVQSGQNCAAGNRILVQENVYEEFLQKFIGAIDGLPMGDPFDADTFVGPLISADAADSVLTTIEKAKNAGMGDLVRGGVRGAGDLASGYYVEPTVFAGVDNTSALAQTEVFGPVTSVIKFRTEEEAIALANDTVYGLVNYVNTNDLARAHRIAQQLQSGTVWVNQAFDVGPYTPYGGFKQSGNGRGGGVEGFHEFQQTKAIRIAIPALS
jgi:aldehyde dehydrogenase (NAD+)